MGLPVSPTEQLFHRHPPDRPRGTEPRGIRPPHHPFTKEHPHGTAHCHHRLVSRLHARPAALFVEAAGETGLDIEIGRPGEDAVDATSILGVMALGAKHGEEIVLTAEGDGADEALDTLVALLSRDLDAE